MLMMSSEPAVVADHVFTTGRIGQVSFDAFASDYGDRRHL